MADHPVDEPAPPDTLGYAEAVAELEGILDELEDDAVDVDRLADRVRRASELIDACRQRIAGARVEVEQIVAELDDELPAAGTDLAPDGG